MLENSCQFQALFEAKRQGVVDFCASDGWVYKWWRCNDSKCTRSHGEVEDIDLDEGCRYLGMNSPAILFLMCLTWMRLACFTEPSLPSCR